MTDCVKIVTDHERINALEERLAAIETQAPCLSGHHEPLMIVDASGAPAPLNLRMNIDNVPMVEIRFCKRCRLAYWNEIRIARLEVG